MSLGIEKSLEVVADLKRLSVSAISLYTDKRPLLLKAKTLWDIGAEVTELVADVPQALPELSDLDPSEAGQLTTATYEAVKAVLAAIGGVVQTLFKAEE